MIQISKPIMTEDEIRSVEAVLRSGMIASGATVTEFENQFSQYIGAKHGIAVSNGTTALHAALLALGIGPADKVLTTPFTFIASSNSIRYCEATPVFGDIDPATFNLSPTHAREILVKDRDGPNQIRAILLVHLFGLPCDMDAFLKLKQEFDVVIIEDCAQAHGATRNGKKAGSFGDIATFSFYATKNMTTGEGGMILTSSDDLNTQVRKLINHGRKDQYSHDLLGFNFRMTNIAAAIGLSQLKRLDAMNARRVEIAKRYSTALATFPYTLPGAPDGSTHVYHQYTVRNLRRDALKTFLQNKGVATAVIYPIPNCQQPAYEGLTECHPKCMHPHAARTAQNVLSIPVHPALTDAEVSSVIEAMKAFIDSK